MNAIEFGLNGWFLLTFQEVYNDSIRAYERDKKKYGSAEGDKRPCETENKRSEYSTDNLDHTTHALRIQRLYSLKEVS